MNTITESLFLLSGYILALVCNIWWFKECIEMNDDWSNMLHRHNKEWAEFCEEIIESHK